MTKKKLFQSAFLMIGLLLTTTIVLADGAPIVGGSGTTSGAGAPIDGGITLLFGASAAYVIKKLKDGKKND